MRRSRYLKGMCLKMTNNDGSKKGLLSVFKRRNEREMKIDRLMQIRQEYSTRALTRTTAAILIVAGSFLGTLTGFMLLSNNPSDLISSSMFKVSESVDVSGYTLDNETGEGVIGVEIVLYDAETEARISNTTTDSNGFYRFMDISVKRLLITAEKDGFLKVERTFTPDQGGTDPLVMHVGSGLIVENEEEVGSILASAVTVSTVVAVFTILTAFVGFYAAHEAKKGRRYRRTQYLAGISLCSRGLIFFGPILILMGMVLLSMTRRQFADFVVDEKSSAGDDT